jgi:hypothetical protein
LATNRRALCGWRVCGRLASRRVALAGWDPRVPAVDRLLVADKYVGARVVGAVPGARLSDLRSGCAGV